MPKLRFIILLLLCHNMASLKVLAGIPPLGHCHVALRADSFLIYLRQAAPVDASSFIKNTDCTPEVQEALVQLVVNYEGVIDNRYLSVMLSKVVNGTQVSIDPLRVRILDLPRFLRESLQRGPTESFTDLQLLGNTESIGHSIVIPFTEKLGLVPSCTGCEGPGEKSIQLQSSHSRFWLSAKIKFKTKVLRLKSSLNAFSSEELASNVEEDSMEVERPEDYFTDMETLKFYKTTHPLGAGTALKNSDLSPLNLVKAGSKTKARINQGNLDITLTVIANSSGHLGDHIQLTNGQSKRTLVGKIIDFDTVKIDL